MLAELSANEACRSVLLISSNSSPRGGGERYLVFMAEGLTELGCKVHALLSSSDYMDYWASELQGVGAVVHRKQFINLRDRPLRFLQAVADIGQQNLVAESCREIRPDAILVNQQYDEDGLDFVLGALKADVAPVAGVIHMPMTADKDKRPFGKLRGCFLRYWYRKHLYPIIFSSEAGKKEFLNYYRLKIPTSVVLSGIPFSSAISDCSQVIQDTDGRWSTFIGDENRRCLPMIGFAGQFVHQKNIDLLIDGWLCATSSGVQTRLLLIGDGPDKESIERKLASVEDTGLWHITGWTKDYAEYLSHLDVFIMPSRFEGLPLTLIEAVGMGIPTIVSNFNGASDIAARASWVDVLEENSVNALGRMIAEKVGKLSTQKEMARSARVQFVEYFSTKRMAEDMLKIFGGLVL